MLQLDNINCYYGAVQVLRDVSFGVAEGEIVGLLGRNGAGKTTTLRTIMGQIKPRSGTITLGESELTQMNPHDVPKLGVAYVPQGRRLFSGMSVEENLRMGLLARESGDDTLKWVLDLFPVLTERMRQRAGTLSGGEQQMLATARALCLKPQLLLLDEPSEGLMPTVVATLLETVASLKEHGVGVLLVEQKVEAALQIADRIVFIENGSVAGEATPAELESDPEPLNKFVGVRR
ncbi:MAG: ABC transporter ATP-binding protein [Alphaproteobacteria bacterium]|nr:ABC transporter ATP-binding protein [Alphaproteobacteria bacterium]|tara:strand:+ start:6146 stop:6847 length:702 start_codon:yes stop_codon:yes gene_type:complete